MTFLACFDQQNIYVHINTIQFTLKKLQIKGWCAEAGEGITLEYEQKDPRNGITRLDDSNPFWVAFKKATDDL